MRVALIFNPAARGANRSNILARLSSGLEAAGHNVMTYPTVIAGHGTSLAHQAIGQEAEVIVAIGGDGTINDIIQGMVGSNVPLAVYPAGTTNVWCKQIGMPSELGQAIRVITHGVRRKIDLGKIDNRYFLLMAGIGLDGEVTSAVNPSLKRHFGKWAYGLPALRLALSFPVGKIKLELDDQKMEVESSLIIVSNTRRYAIFELAPAACLDDGLLEVLILEDKSVRIRLQSAVSFAINRSEHDLNIKRYKVRQLSVQSQNELGIQVDGDAAGRTSTTPVQIECVPLALEVIIPENHSSNLFRHI